MVATLVKQQQTEEHCYCALRAYGLPHHSSVEMSRDFLLFLEKNPKFANCELTSAIAGKFLESFEA